MTKPASVSATRREETIVRLGGHGDNFHPTWAADDNQYIAVCDGYGFVDPAVAFYNRRMTQVAGDPVTGVGRYYNFGTIVIEPFDERSTDNMAFFHEDGGTFALPSFLQIGKDYSANSDGYVYSPNSPADRTMNQIVMFRVPKDKILDRGYYEYFAGRGADGASTWSSDITKRGVVHENPTGWVNK